MIDEIQVRNVALIQQATLVPSRGLTVLTGETGAGKTALLSALKLLMGARADRDMVRDGADELEVSGRFFGLVQMRAAFDGVDDEAFALSADRQGSSDRQQESGQLSFDDFDDETVVVRRVGKDGRSRASLNGSLASVRELAETIAPSIDLCGQFEHQQLMRPAVHVDLLDAWAHDAVASPLAAYQDAFARARDAQEQLARIEEHASATSAKVEEARFTLARIDELDPQEGEYEQLRYDLERAEHAESLSLALGGAYGALSDDGAALDSLNQAAAHLESVGAVDPQLSSLAESLREVGYVMEDVAREVRSYYDDIEFDPEMLAFKQERFAHLQGLMKKYGPTMEQVFERRAEAQTVVDMVDNADQLKHEAEQALKAAEAALAQAADELDRARNEQAPLFAAAVSEVMGRLEMGSAELECAITRNERASWTKTGPSNVEFMYRPGTNMTARPLARIASGGEVSRVMLAIKVVLGKTDNVDTLVFDEVDAGVGGSTAVALAEVLSGLARTHQVIVVTHLAQVAVFADAHYLVAKQQCDDSSAPQTLLARVAGEQRVEEIARMLSGRSTAASRAHAKEMLAQAAARTERA